VHARDWHISDFYVRVFATLMPGDVHPRLPVPGLGCGIGRIIVIPVFIFTGYKAAIASIAF
jgi:hypothetical protein